MSIGGDIYKKLLKKLESIEKAIHSEQDFQPSLAEIDSISELFRLNHQVSFDFLRSNEVSKQERLRRLGKIMTLLSKLNTIEEEQVKASEELSKYR